MTGQVLKTERDYNQALKQLEKVFLSPADSPEGRKAELLVLLISQYEDIHYSIGLPDPIEAIKIRMEDNDLKVSDLVKMGVFSKSGASMVLNKVRPLTLKMIRQLSVVLTLPLEVLTQEYELNNSTEVLA